MSHATVRATILPEIIKLICQKNKVSEMKAIDMFYDSATGANFATITRGCTDNRRFTFTGCLKQN